MNERIRELAEQAGAIGYDDDGNELTPVLVGKDLEKFAELIVRECARVCNNIDAEYEGEDVLATWCATAIREHFGVEE